MRPRPLFPPLARIKTKSKFRHKGKQSADHSTVNGVVNVNRIYWWSAEEGRDDTIDRLIGIVADGAEWIRKQLESKLPMLDSQILDFYHMGEHVWAASNTCFNQGSNKAKEFASEILYPSG